MSKIYTQVIFASQVNPGDRVVVAGIVRKVRDVQKIKTRTLLVFPLGQSGFWCKEYYKGDRIPKVVKEDW